MPGIDKMPTNDSITERAMKISTEAASVGFDWENPMDVLDKIVEELAEIRMAFREEYPDLRVEEEVGDLFFALVNFCRKMQFDPAHAFDAGVQKFERRFEALRSIVEQSGKSMSDLSSQELEEIWRTVKMREKNG